MSFRARSRVAALILSLLPGWGHIYWGREIVGLGMFTAFVVGSFALVNGLFLYLGSGRPYLVQGALVLLVSVVAATWIDILRRTSPARVDREGAERNHSLREGMIAYLRGEHEAAKALFRSCVKVDPADVEALFRLGMTCARSGQVGEARSWLKRTRKCDLEDKWRWEVEEELRRLSSARRGAAKPKGA